MCYRHRLSDHIDTNVVRAARFSDDVRAEAVDRRTPIGRHRHRDADTT
jgi:hypothetical protein